MFHTFLTYTSKSNNFDIFWISICRKVDCWRKYIISFMRISSIPNFDVLPLFQEGQLSVTRESICT